MTAAASHSDSKLRVSSEALEACCIVAPMKAGMTGIGYAGVRNSWHFDAAGYPETKTLRPMARHTGYGLSFLIEVLSAVLTGAAPTRRRGSWMASGPSRPTEHGAALITVDVAAVGTFRAFVERIELIAAGTRRPRSYHSLVANHI